MTRSRRHTVFSLNEIGARRSLPTAPATPLFWRMNRILSLNAACQMADDKLPRSQSTTACGCQYFVKRCQSQRVRDPLLLLRKRCKTHTSLNRRRTGHLLWSLDMADQRHLNVYDDSEIYQCKGINIKTQALGNWHASQFCH